jgi:GNAT superfamily N-acetyltransferase
MRSHIEVRVAGLADLADLVEMCPETPELAVPPQRLPLGLGQPSLASLIAEALDDPACRIFLATSGKEAVGMAVASVMPPAPLTTSMIVQVSHVVVRSGHRRRGVGRALLDAAAVFAEESGAEQIVVSVFPLSREVNRFYAQLGFSPLAVRRVAPVAGLRRRIASLEHRSAPLDQVSRRRHLASRPLVRTALRRLPIGSSVAEQAGES